MDAEQARNRIDELWRNLQLEDYRSQDINPTAYSWLQDMTAPTTTAASITANTIGDNTGQYTANTYNNDLGRLGALTAAQASLMDAAPSVAATLMGNAPTVAASLMGNAPTATASLVGNFNPFETQGYDAFVGDLARIDTSQSNQSRDQQAANLRNWDQLAAKGLNENERAAVQKVSDTAQLERARADASIRDDMIRRGTAGSGSELAQRLAAAQGAANMAASQGNAMNDLILQRQNQALAASDSLASNMRAQDQSLAAQQAALFDSFQRSRENIVNDARKYSADAANRSREAAFNANAQGAMTNAQLQTNTALDNARREQERLAFNAQQNQQVGIENARRQDSRDLYNSQSQTSMDLENARRQDSRDLYNSQSQTSMNLENARRQDARDQYNSSLLADNSRYNTNALNDAARFNADAAYRNATFNANAQNAAASANAQLLQNQRQFDAGNSMAASQWNLGQRQQMANDNVTMRNRAAETNLDRYNSVQGLRNQQKYNYVTGYSNALNGVAAGLDNAEAARAANSNNATKGWIDAGLGAVKAIGTIADVGKNIMGWW